jgi:hypothetical protein
MDIPRPHARYEQFALSHVLGGLARADANDFRAHLRDCGHCRARVAELRGISNDLDVAAREERRRAADEPPGRREGPGAPVTAARGSGRLGVLLVALVVVAGFGFWNLHLRTTAETYFVAAEERAAILRDVAAGTLVGGAELAGFDARVAVTTQRIALVVADGGPLGSDERLVAWLLPLGSSLDESVVLAVGPRPDSEVAVRLDRGVASELVVTRERGLLSSSGPRGVELFRVALSSTRPGT